MQFAALQQISKQLNANFGSLRGGKKKKNLLHSSLRPSFFLRSYLRPFDDQRLRRFSTARLLFSVCPPQFCTRVSQSFQFLYYRKCFRRNSFQTIGASVTSSVLDSLARMQEVIKPRMRQDYYEIIHSAGCRNWDTSVSLSLFDFAIISQIRILNIMIMHEHMLSLCFR